MKIDHVNIVVADIERAAEFYSRIFGWRRGFEKVLEGAWIETVTGISGARAHCVFMEAEAENQTSEKSSVRLELLQYLTPGGALFPENSRPDTRGLRHLAFEVDDLDALISRLKAAGVQPISAPVEVPFAVAAMGRKRLCYFHDPDGTLLEAAAND